MVKWQIVRWLLLCTIVFGLGDDSAQSHSNDETHDISTETLKAEDLVIVTNMPREILRSYGQHTKVINDAYCSRYLIAF